MITRITYVVLTAAATALVAAPVAAADEQILPRAGDSAADTTVQQLESAGYTVSVNFLQGHPNVPLSECKVTGISGLSGSTTSSDVMMMLMDPSTFDTAYVDVSCPNAK